MKKEYLSSERERRNSKNYYHKNKERVKGLVRNRKLKHRYGIDYTIYQSMFEGQNGRCAICGIHQSETEFSLGVDHDHETKYIRGLLCKKCNSGIGMFNDDIDLMNKAIQYIIFHKKTE